MIENTRVVVAGDVNDSAFYSQGSTGVSHKSYLLVSPVDALLATRKRYRLFRGVFLSELSDRTWVFFRRNRRSQFANHQQRFT